MVASLSEPLRPADGGRGLLDPAVHLQLVELGPSYIVGLIFDLIPVVLFLHVYLAVPTGRLGGPRVERSWPPAYFVAVGLRSRRRCSARAVRTTSWQ